MSTPTTPQDRPSAGAIALMSITVLWAGFLAVAFAWSAAAGGPAMTVGRRVVFGVLAAFLALLASRTGYELFRRLLRRS